MHSSTLDSSELLAKASQAAARPARGKLRIYFGAASGVGKTEAMLFAARQNLAAGRDVLMVETGFDLDTVLTRRPALLVLPQLAHSNPEPARHPKRWQDVEEILCAGIDVFTTLNVQHLESLNDVVRHITHTPVDETLPDTVLQQADQVILIDCPVDELMQRRHHQAGATLYSRDSLIALRELALRCCADHVERELRGQRQASAIKSVWKTNSSLLACIGPESEAEHVIRSTAQLAGQLNAHWHAIYIETPQLQNLAAARRQIIFEHLQLAQSLGANTAVLAGNDIALTIADYAREQNPGASANHRFPVSVWVWPFAVRL